MGGAILLAAGVSLLWGNVWMGRFLAAYERRTFALTPDNRLPGSPP